MAPSVSVPVVQVWLVRVGVGRRPMGVLVGVPCIPRQVGVAVAVVAIIVAVWVGVGQRLVLVWVAMVGREHQDQRAHHQHACADLRAQYRLTQREP